MRKSTLFCVIAALSFGSPASAFSEYGVTVTRKSSNLYKVDSQAVWVQTQYCYEYVYYEDAILSAYEIVFVDSSTKCDVRRIMREADVDDGDYKVSVTHEADELYSTSDGFFIRTSMCLELGMNEEAVLRVSRYGSSALVFLDNGRKCAVEQVLNQMRI